MTLRAFIAVEVGPLDEILKFEQEIKTTGAEVKLVEPENIHITLLMKLAIQHSITSTESLL